jgi:hypothetical protein
MIHGMSWNFGLERIFQHNYLIPRVFFATAAIGYLRRSTFPHLHWINHLVVHGCGRRDGCYTADLCPFRGMDRTRDTL